MTDSVLQPLTVASITEGMMTYLWNCSSPQLVALIDAIRTVQAHRQRAAQPQHANMTDGNTSYAVDGNDVRVRKNSKDKVTKNASRPKAHKKTSGSINPGLAGKRPLNSFIAFRGKSNPSCYS